jgi:hypothetical protein
MRISTLLFLAALGVACGNTSVPDGGTPAEGGGICCPISGSNCAGSGGGWAATSSQCPMGTSYDAPVKVSTDGHGCPYWANDPGRCCGCVNPDSGADTGADAPVDSPSDAPDG